MPWILYLHVESVVESVLKKIESVSQQIERDKEDYWIELRGPHTVFQVLGKLKGSSNIMALAPNKWLAKLLALTVNTLPTVRLSDSLYLWKRKNENQEIFWLGPGETGDFQKVLPKDFYPSLISARTAWAAWFASKIWGDIPIEGLWFLERKTIGKMERLGFQKLGQLALLGDDFLIRETGNPFLPLFLKGGEGLPGLKANYPPKSLQVFRELSDTETQSEGDWVQMAKVVRQLTFELAEELAGRNMGCLTLRLTVLHDGESFVSERQFSSPEQEWLSLAETVLLMAKRLELESFGKVCLEAEDLCPAVHKQYSLFAQTGRETRDPRLTALTVRFPGVLKKGVSLSRREKMLSHWDPWRSQQLS